MNTSVKDTVVFSGKGTGSGNALGKIYFYRHAYNTVPKESPHNTHTAVQETEKLREAIETADRQLSELYDLTLADAGKRDAEIFEIHRMLLHDEDFAEGAESLIHEGFSASYAIEKTAEKYRKMFASIDDEYLSAREADIKDVSDRLIRILDGADMDTNDGMPEENEKYIIAADDLTPGETVKLDRKKILGFVTFAGSPNSHTAILARSLGIPALVGTGEISPAYNGETAIIDAQAGVLYINPDTALIDKYSISDNEARRRRESLEHLKGKPSLTRSGRHINVFANIGNTADCVSAMENDAEGIGLLRSEFLYLGESECPDEQKLFLAYKDVAESMRGKRVIIRTLDVGADKKAGYLNLPNEENPAMGERGVRFTLRRKDLFTTQLRAICRASAYGSISLMIPMITLVKEVSECKKLLRDVQNGLEKQGVAFDRNMPFGIMIETPSAVMMSKELAEEVDFFSVGTNDLAQYTLASDRQNPAVSDICGKGTEAVMRMIEIAVRNARDAGIWTGICGELASDLTLTEQFIKMGIDELSVSPPYILALREKIMNCE